MYVQYMYSAEVSLTRVSEGVRPVVRTYHISYPKQQAKIIKPDHATYKEGKSQ